MLFISFHVAKWHISCKNKGIWKFFPEFIDVSLQYGPKSDIVNISGHSIFFGLVKKVDRKKVYDFRINVFDDIVNNIIKNIKIKHTNNRIRSYSDRILSCLLNCPHNFVESVPEREDVMIIIR